ncbi:sensor histidine kinase [Tropicibacter oceani]|uniref:histidine kinase n=1 Tax=Tropicibacter oceani TaxID=3058420 RepID=A0ABY8QHX4_9RHOB|nr:sensor histidine kinase [Tropicibacter oceani]WGW03601.1 sensor histidine kinase N-terminal domain-containing protein [Tropicibacter oceani]
MSRDRHGFSIRRRLTAQLLVVAAVLAGLLFYSIRTVADVAVEQTQDRILGAATLAIAEELRGGQDGIVIDIPYSAFSMLGALGNDRIFYRIEVNGELATGYADLPLPPTLPSGLDPEFYDSRYLGYAVRVAAVSRSVLVAGKTVPVLIVVAQTRSVQESIVAGLTNRALLLGLGFFGLAALLAVAMARSVLQPVNDLAGAVTRRGPQDLRPVKRQVPEELGPLVNALNGFIGRLSGALSRTETFIAEAAHYIRTPLTTLRAQSEIALRQTESDETKEHLRKIIRLADNTARSASQLLDHAAVIYRTDQRSDEALALDQVIADIVEAFRPSAEMRDIELGYHRPDTAVTIAADRLLIETVIRNLIDNAIKYSDELGAVEVALSAADGFARITVSDRGRGLGGMKLEALGNRFERGGNVQDVIGSGLGLSIVTEVARAYGGTLELTERKGGGACACFSLPLA